MDWEHFWLNSLITIDHTELRTKYKNSERCFEIGRLVWGGEEAGGGGGSADSAFVSRSRSNCTPKADFCTVPGLLKRASKAMDWRAISAWTTSMKSLADVF